MILGIMQPYFFPYLGYYQLMTAVDRWIVFDTVQYSRKSWMSRNRMLHPVQGWQYVGVPVHSRHDGPLSAATVADADAALRRILGQIAHYRGKAPHFEAVRGLVIRAFAAAGSDTLRDLNLQTLLVVLDYLELALDWSLLSDMDLRLPPIDHPGRWALEICSAIGATRYLNAPGGRGLFPPAEWHGRNIELSFLVPIPLAYDTAPYTYQPDLSILDVLMWNDAQTVRRHLLEARPISRDA